MENRHRQLLRTMDKCHSYFRLLVGSGLVWLLCHQAYGLDRTIAPTSDLGGDLGDATRRRRTVHIATNMYGTNTLVGVGTELHWNGVDISAAGSGDMLKAVYDTDTDNLVDQS